MTFYAFRHNIEPMLFGVTLVMMVLACLLAAITRLGDGSGQLAGGDCVVYGVSRLAPIGVRLIISSEHFFEFVGLLIYSVLLPAMFGLIQPVTSCLSFLAIFVTSIRHSPFIAFAVLLLNNFVASLTLTTIPISLGSILVKSRQWLNLFALRALFCYDWFRHGFFLCKKLCFEPLESQPLCGFSSLYHNSRGCQAW